MIGLLGELYSTFPVDQGNTNFDFRGMIGSIFASSPEVTVTASFKGESQQATLNSWSATSFAFMIGAGIIYNAGT